MPTCLQCGKPTDSINRLCGIPCQSRYASALGKTARKVGRATAPTEVDQPQALPGDLPPEVVRRLVYEGYLPESHTISPTTGQPLWAFRELAELLGVSQTELTEILTGNGQAYLRVPIGIPSRLVFR